MGIIKPADKLPDYFNSEIKTELSSSIVAVGPNSKLNAGSEKGTNREIIEGELVNSDIYLCSSSSKSDIIDFYVNSLKGSRKFAVTSNEMGISANEKQRHVAQEYTYYEVIDIYFTESENKVLTEIRDMEFRDSIN